MMAFHQSPSHKTSHSWLVKTPACSGTGLLFSILAILEELAFEGCCDSLFRVVVYDIYIYMCVCVCVCERERERERESVCVWVSVWHKCVYHHTGKSFSFNACIFWYSSGCYDSPQARTCQQQQQVPPHSHNLLPAAACSSLQAAVKSTT
jgi:hypothetical protein